MAIKINNLSGKNIKGYTYTDLHLDLEPIYRDGNVGTNSKNIVEGNDIKVDYDISAIRNSLINIITTNPGERILNPSFGISLNRFIGSPINDITGTAIAKEIQRGIQLWEPRVELKNVYILSNPDEYLFETIIIVSPVRLTNQQIILNGLLSQEKGFRFELLKK